MKYYIIWYMYPCNYGIFSQERWSSRHLITQFCHNFVNKPTGHFLTSIYFLGQMLVLYLLCDSSLQTDCCMNTEWCDVTLCLTHRYVQVMTQNRFLWMIVYLKVINFDKCSEFWVPWVCHLWVICSSSQDSHSTVLKENSEEGLSFHLHSRTDSHVSFVSVKKDLFVPFSQRHLRSEEGTSFWF